MNQIKQYLGTTSEDINYDVLLVDADTNKRIEKFDLLNADKRFFVTAFDLYSLKKGLEILAELEKPMSLTKVLYAREALKEDDDNLN